MKTKIKAILFPKSSVPPALPTVSSLRRIPIHEEIACDAYALWVRQGRPEGQHTANWLEAEQKLRNGIRLSKVEDAAFGDRETPLDADGEPTGAIQERLRGFGYQSGARSATSL